jgi:hypothetical protein
MITKFIEASSAGNWGKFMLARFTPEEWAYRSAVDERPLIHARGWASWHIMIFDMQTGEGALFRPGGLARADLRKHQIWVCPLFEPFLEWLYTQDVADFEALPASIELPDAPFSFSGYRRPGPDLPPGVNCSQCGGRLPASYTGDCIHCGATNLPAEAFAA